MKWCIVHRSMSPRAVLPLALSITACSLGNFPTLNNPAWAPFISAWWQNDSKSFLKAPFPGNLYVHRAKRHAAPFLLITSKFDAFSYFTGWLLKFSVLKANHYSKKKKRGEGICCKKWSTVCFLIWFHVKCSFVHEMEMVKLPDWKKLWLALKHVLRQRTKSSMQLEQQWVDMLMWSGSYVKGDLLSLQMSRSAFQTAAKSKRSKEEEWL